CRQLSPISAAPPTIPGPRCSTRSGPLSVLRRPGWCGRGSARAGAMRWVQGYSRSAPRLARSPPNIGALMPARAAQGRAGAVVAGEGGWAGGLGAGRGMALITGLFDARLRTRIIVISQGTFTACHLSGPIVGGLFAAMNWWRGSFWTMVPFMLLFTWLAYSKIPDRLDPGAERRRFSGFPCI